jgi:phosphopantothenoylcysteine decarboxylase/phosphopantothenate--cysteine ligase
VEVPLPAGAAVVRVETAAELGAALSGAMGGAIPPDALVMAAAVADFTPSRVADGKIARADGLTLELSPTPDLLAGVAAAARGAPTPPVLVGFAAETGGLDRAPGKLQAKGIDLLVGNDVAEPGSGLGTDTNRVTIFDRDGGREALPMLSKREVADRILDRVARALDARQAPAQTSASTTSRTLEGQSA